jgi:hypothetical protein
MMFFDVREPPRSCEEATIWRNSKKKQIKPKKKNKKKKKRKERGER